MNKIIKKIKTKETNTELLATFVHELKTPVTSIKEAISLLVDACQDKIDKKRHRILLIAQDEINRLARMIDNFLKFASIEAGKVRLLLEPIKIHEVLNEVIESQTILLQKKKMRVKKIYTVKDITLLADRDRIFEAIANLIDNALKFTPENNTVTIQTKTLKPHASLKRNYHINPKFNYLMFTISDTGPGIPKKDLDRVFIKFERLRTPNKTRGIGLGLTIAKDIIELHQGKIWATSEMGKGASFHFVIPIKT
jgi:two-component system sensor histidine kinase VicK